jgi:hypothetical protein
VLKENKINGATRKKEDVWIDWMNSKVERITTPYQSVVAMLPCHERSIYVAAVL